MSDKIVASAEEAKHSKLNFSSFKKDLSNPGSDVSPAFKKARQRETLVKALTKMRELGIALGNIAVEGRQFSLLVFADNTRYHLRKY